MDSLTAELFRRKKSCKYPNCQTVYYTNTINKHFYRFPRNPVSYQRWREALKLDESINCRNFVVCEDHFLPKDFVDESKRRLNYSVVPVPFLDNNDVINHDHCYFSETTDNQTITTDQQQHSDGSVPATSDPPPLPIDMDYNYIRIEGPDLMRIESIAIPNNLNLPKPILIQTKQPKSLNSGGVNNFLQIDNQPNTTRHTRPALNSVGTMCNLVSPMVEMKFRQYEETQRALRRKVRLLQYRHGKARRNLRDLRAMLKKEDLIGLIQKRKFKCFNNLTETGELFLISQLRNAGKTPYARRYTSEELDFFIELYSKGPAVYRFLDQYLILPSIRTIRMEKHKRSHINEHNYVIEIGCDLQELEDFVEQNNFAQLF